MDGLGVLFLDTEYKIRWRNGQTAFPVFSRRDNPEITVGARRDVFMSYHGRLFYNRLGASKIRQCVYLDILLVREGHSQDGACTVYALEVRSLAATQEQKNG